MPVNNETVLYYTIGFFIYFNIKVALFFAFFKYGKDLIRRRKNAIKVKKMTEAELREWYEKSVFKKISKIEYNKEMAESMLAIRGSYIDVPPEKKTIKERLPEKIQLGNLTIISGVIPKYTIVNGRLKAIKDNDSDTKIDKKNVV
ncbi:hypothetical protein HZA55_00310 [Candidatus Poribacteria bacterium]|nr:hypothetical protein [Candidatus Poribacteria bacterium]